MVRSRTLLLAIIASAAIGAALRPAAAETVLLDFTSDHCPPCREMEPILRQMAAEGIKIRQVDVARESELVRQLRVDSTPTFIVVVDGREWARNVGATNRATLVEMMRKATDLAAADRPTASEPGGEPAAAEAPATNDAIASAPMGGGATTIQDPFKVRTTSGNPAPIAQGIENPETPGAMTTPLAGAAASPDHLVAATVRLSVADPNGRSTGTGVVVDARNGMALVLTCGHLFRESAGRGAVEISLFTAGPGGAELRGKVAGEVIDFDLDRDLALVRFKVDGPVDVAPVAPLGTPLETGASVTCVGCSHGENPTPWATRLTAINRYQGHPNIEAARAPVEGRSGGGLFNSTGQLIGVCFAADPQGDEGLYASLPSIHAKLDELKLAMVYQSPATAGVVDARATAAATRAPVSPTNAAPPNQFAVRGQNPAPVASTTLPGNWPAHATPAPAAATATAAMSAEEQAALQEIARRGADSEVICIIRPKSPDGRSEVIKIREASPAFVEALAKSAAAAESSTAAAPAGYRR
jgi:thiol-disulfide isomerase/thioredoxin